MILIEKRKDKACRHQGSSLLFVNHTVPLQNNLEFITPPSGILNSLYGAAHFNLSPGISHTVECALSVQRFTDSGVKLVKALPYLLFSVHRAAGFGHRIFSEEVPVLPYRTAHASVGLTFIHSNILFTPSLEGIGKNARINITSSVRQNRVL